MMMRFAFFFASVAAIAAVSVLAVVPADIPRELNAATSDTPAFGRFFQESVCSDPPDTLSGRAHTIMPLNLCLFGTITTFELKADFAKVAVSNTTTLDGTTCDSSPSSPSSSSFERVALLPLLINREQKVWHHTSTYATEVTSDKRVINSTSRFLYFGNRLRSHLISNETAVFVSGFNSTRGKCLKLLRIEAHPALRTMHYSTMGSAPPSVDSFRGEDRHDPCNENTSVLVFENATSLFENPSFETYVPPRRKELPTGGEGGVAARRLASLLFSSGSSSASSLSLNERRLEGVTLPPAADITNCGDASAINKTSYAQLVNNTAPGAYDLPFQPVFLTMCNASTQEHRHTLGPTSMECVNDRFRYSDCSVGNYGDELSEVCARFGFFVDAACTQEAEDAAAMAGGQVAPFVNAAPKHLDVVCANQSTNGTLQFYAPFAVQAQCNQTSLSSTFTLANDCADDKFFCTYKDVLTTAAPCVASSIFPGRYVKVLEADTKSCMTVRVKEYPLAGCGGESTASITFPTTACDGDGFGFSCINWNKTKYQRFPIFRVTVSDFKMTPATLVTKLAALVEGAKTDDFDVVGTRETWERAALPNETTTTTPPLSAGDPPPRPPEPVRRRLFRVRPKSLQIGARLNALLATEIHADGSILRFDQEAPLDYFAPIPELPFFEDGDYIGLGFLALIYFVAPLCVYIGRKFDEYQEDKEAEAQLEEELAAEKRVAEVEDAQEAPGPRLKEAEGDE